MGKVETCERGSFSGLIRSDRFSFLPSAIAVVRSRPKFCPDHKLLLKQSPSACKTVNGVSLCTWLIDNCDRAEKVRF